MVLTMQLAAVLFAINLLSLFYIWCRGSFARIEFWIFYFLNLGWSGFLIATNIVKKHKIIKLNNTI